MVDAAPLAPASASFNRASIKVQAEASDFRLQVLLVLAVLAAWGPLLLVNQALWDDWVLLADYDSGTLWELARQIGHRELYLTLAPFAALGEPRAWIATALLLSCALPPLIYIIIRRTTKWPAADAFCAAFLTAVAPLNQARFILSTVSYALSSFYFVLGLVLLLRDLDRPHFARRIVIVILLVEAFATHSFLMLSWIGPAIVALAAWRKIPADARFAERASPTIRAVIGRGELVLLPLIYWPAKHLLEPTYGLYASYNKFSTSVPAALKQTFITVIEQFRDLRAVLPPLADLPGLFIAAAIMIGILAGLAQHWRLLRVTEEDRTDAPHWLTTSLTLATAAVLVICALFPYVIVGKPPRFTGLWETRHQTTLILMVGFASLALLRLIVPWPLARRLVVAGIATVFLLLDLSFTGRMVTDARETHALLESFRQSPSPPGTMMFVIEDDRDYRALGRFFPFYELSFLVNGGKSGPNLAISNREVFDPATGTYARSSVPAVTSALTGLCQTFRSHPEYGFDGFTSNGTIETARLVATRKPPGFLEAISLSLGTEAAKDSPVQIERSTSPIGGACKGPCCGPG